VTGKSDDVPLPTSLLLDRAGQLVVIYQGAIDVDRLLDDVARLRDMDPKRASTTGISGGLWVDRGRRDFKLLTEAFDGLGHELLSTYYAEQ
jgi:hypothetical protein